MTVWCYKLVRGNNNRDKLKDYLQSIPCKFDIEIISDSEYYFKVLCSGRQYTWMNKWISENLDI